MSITFNVAVKDTVTYYWKLIYNQTIQSFQPVGIVSQAAAVNGGPTYGVELSSSARAYYPVGITWQLNDELAHTMTAAYVGMGDGCPGVGFLKTTFIRSVGTNSYYTVKFNGVICISGLITAGDQSDNAMEGLPPGGNISSCAQDGDGITGGNV